MARLILASGSPRRKELMEALRVPELIVRPARGEEIVPENASPDAIVMALARQKAAEVFPTAEAGDVVIAADTIVWMDGLVLGKPHSTEEAFSMLSRLSGRSHSVFTGVCVMAGDTVLCEAEETKVSFRELSPEEIRSYIATGEPMDKAGAYGAQGYASLFVEKLEGDFFNVMGLPLCALGNLLKRLDVSLI